MNIVKISYQGEATRRFGNVLAALGAGKARVAFVRAINHQGDKANTTVKRVLVKQMNTKYKYIQSAFTRKRAWAGAGGASGDGTGAKLDYIIAAHGKELPLKFFYARQTRAGVSAAPLGRRQIFAKTFNTGGVFPNRKKVFGGHVMIRESPNRFPVKKLYGPAVADQLVQGASLAAFEQHAAGLPDRLAHEIDRML